MKRVTLFFLLLPGLLRAQNLVLNPGFSDRGTTRYYGFLPMDFFQFFAVGHWITPTLGSSDYFFKGVNGYNCPLENYAGPIAVSSGSEDSAFAGIIPWIKGREYREYLQGELSNAPEKGKVYTFSMQIATGSSCGHLVEELGVYFSADRTIDAQTMKTLARTPQVRLNLSPLIGSPEGWVTVCGTFTAAGDEQYFTIGNFNTDAQTSVSERAGISIPTDWCYYYIDQVSLVPGAQSCGKSTALQQHFQPGKTFVTRDIHFDTDRATIRAESYVTLYAILAELKKQPQLKITIGGHTDSTGSAAHNQELSEARARAVADFLVSNGIPKENISWKGFGSSIPVSATDMALNRRVEFVFR